MAKKDAKQFQMNDNDHEKFRRDRKAFTDQYRIDPMLPTGLNQPFPNPMADLNHRKDIKAKLNKIDYYSGYFEPTKSTTKDTALLKDSVYVKVFRDVAYRRTVNERTVTTVAIAVVGGAIVLIGAIAFLIAHTG